MKLAWKPCILWHLVSTVCIYAFRSDYPFSSQCRWLVCHSHSKWQADIWRLANITANRKALHFTRQLSLVLSCSESWKIIQLGWDFGWLQRLASKGISLTSVALKENLPELLGFAVSWSLYNPVPPAVTHFTIQQRWNSSYLSPRPCPWVPDCSPFSATEKRLQGKTCGAGGGGKECRHKHNWSNPGQPEGLQGLRMGFFKWLGWGGGENSCNFFPESSRKLDLPFKPSEQNWPTWCLSSLFKVSIQISKPVGLFQTFTFTRGSITVIPNVGGYSKPFTCSFSLTLLIGVCARMADKRSWSWYRLGQTHLLCTAVHENI